MATIDACMDNIFKREQLIGKLFSQNKVGINSLRSAKYDFTRVLVLCLLFREFIYINYI